MNGIAGMKSCKKPSLTHKQNIATKFANSKKTYIQHAFVQANMADQLTHYIPKKIYNQVLEIGFGHGLFTEKLIKSHVINQLTLNELTDAFSYKIPEANYLFDDFESLELTQRYDLICSNAVFQWFNSLEDQLSKIAQHLNDDGILAFTTFGPTNFKELKAFDIGLDYHSKGNIIDKMDTMFEVIYSKKWETVLTFKNLRLLFDHLSNTGVNGVNTPDSYKKLKKFILKNQSTELKLTYTPILIVCKKK